MKKISRAIAALCFFACALALACPACLADAETESTEAEGEPQDLASILSAGGACSGTYSTCIGADGLTGKCGPDDVCCTGCLDIDGTCFLPNSGCSNGGNACTTSCHPMCLSFFDCPGVECNYPSCNRTGHCSYTPAPMGLPCGSGTQLCDGLGHCI